MEPKVFNDPVHGHMEFHPILVKIIDTPHFQRLRYIKQLGGAYFVYPGASHNRFEHSLGTAHLAGQLVQSLKRNQPELDIDDRDILCVEIAGLCHDLGHGPFSHMFDGMFIPKSKHRPGWKHETASIEMFDDIVKYLEKNNYDLKLELSKLCESNENDDIMFIKEMIDGPNKQEHFEGRPPNKYFLYEIISNKRNSIDVDKFDYFARDCHHLGLKNCFDYTRYIKFAKVFEVDGQQQICTRDKEMSNVYEMFHTRSSLHRKAYQHKTNKIIEVMITDALLKADRDLTPEGENPEHKCLISRAIDKMDDYLKLTDDIFEKICYSTDPELKDAREILQNILSRKLYKYLGKVKITDELFAETEEQWKTELAQRSTYRGETPLTEDDFEIIISCFDFGKKGQNPMESLYVYDKFNNVFKIPSEQVSQFLLPNKFSEKWINVYYKNMNNVNVAQRNFHEWCRRKNLYLPQICRRSARLAGVPQPKVFNDPIHGHMEFHPTLVKIIDTPEFQRLRFIKQLGAAYFVYPGASHNRFEHSLGVAYLAGQFLKRLQKEHLSISDKDILCVEIAGLCLDIGRAPFSADVRLDPKNRNQSVVLFRTLEKNLDLNMDEMDKTFIEEMIIGEGPQNSRPGKRFLYDILTNRKNGVGVKLFDSVARDCYNMGLKTNFNHHRFIKFTKVLEVNGENQICIRDKVIGNLFDLWHTVVALHSKAYQHRVTMTIQNMIPVENEVETDNLLFERHEDIMERIHSRDLDYFKHEPMARPPNFSTQDDTNPIKVMHFYDRLGAIVSQEQVDEKIKNLKEIYIMP
ncbi:unnamed protein product [Knipowitschia caucasica]